jgi:hypothetical protein
MTGSLRRSDLADVCYIKVLAICVFVHLYAVCHPCWYLYDVSVVYKGYVFDDEGEVVMM